MLESEVIKEESTDRRRILPVFFPPPIITYLYFPYQLSIILAHEKTKAWFYSNYIQLFSKLDSNSIWLFHFFPDIYMVQHNQYFIDVAHINENVVDIRKGEITGKICDWIKSGYYVCVILSESALPGAMMYGGEPYPHPQFFFGYDLSTGTLKMTNFNRRGTYSVIDVKFDDFEKALFSDDTAKAMETYSSWDHSFPGKYLFILYKFNDKELFKYELDVAKIEESLEDYLFSRDTSYRYKLVAPWILEYSDSQWGLSVYENLVIYLETLGESGLDYRAFHGLWEHKKIMTSRLKYLEGLGYLDLNSACSEKYFAIENQTNAIRQYLLKCLFSKERIHLEKIIPHIRNIASEEKIILNHVCDLLKSGKPRQIKKAVSPDAIGESINMQQDIKT